MTEDKEGIEEMELAATNSNSLESWLSTIEVCCFLFDLFVGRDKRNVLAVTSSSVLVCVDCVCRWRTFSSLVFVLVTFTFPFVAHLIIEIELYRLR